ANEVRTFYRELARRPGDRGSGHHLVHRRLEEIQTPNPLDELVEQLDGTLARAREVAEEVSRRVRARVEPKTWKAFWLTAVGGKSADDVARRLDMEVAAVYRAKYRVREMLRAEGERVQAARRREGGRP